MTCDRVTIINRGQVVATNTPDKLMADLTGNISYQLEVSDIGVNTVTQLLRPLDGVIEVESSPVSERPDRLHVTVRSSGTVEIGPQCITKLIQAGGQVYEMRRLRATLEDVFLNLITSDESHSEEVASSEVSNSTTATTVDSILRLMQPRVCLKTIARGEWSPTSAWHP